MREEGFRPPVLAGSDLRSTVRDEVTSWEGVTLRRGSGGTLELRFGRHVLGTLPLSGRVDDERTLIRRMRDAYERAQDALDRSAGVGA